MRCIGLRRRSTMERHEKVLIDTMIITATSAAIGMMRTRSSSTRMRNSRKAPATKVDSRPRPPERTLMTDWPIMAQPPMPPISADGDVARALADAFAALVAGGVGHVVDDLRRQQRFQQADRRQRRANRGRMICSVSRVSGTCGKAQDRKRRRATRPDRRPCADPCPDHQTSGRQHGDGDERRWHGLGDEGQQVDDREPGRRSSHR